ncbi:hypothetical protein, partial [Vibrio azureus]|uniref:hypothetical protein n=1 Tax=Vibrio azureus TaxID=512649 RepID=UPI000519A225
SRCLQQALIHHSSDTARSLLALEPMAPDSSDEQKKQRENTAKELNKHQYARVDYAVTKNH